MSDQQFSEELIQKIAHLSRLELTADEVKTFTAQLKDVLSYVDKLGNVDTNNVNALYHPTQNEENRSDRRQDRVVEPPGHEKMLENAPRKKHQYFQVPRVI